MLPAVEFNNHALGKAHKIYNEPSQNLLPTEFITGESFAAQLMPQGLLVGGLITPQLAGSVCKPDLVICIEPLSPRGRGVGERGRWVITTRLPEWVSPLSPSPSPAKGEGSTSGSIMITGSISKNVCISVAD